MLGAGLGAERLIRAQLRLAPAAYHGDSDTAKLIAMAPTGADPGAWKELVINHTERLLSRHWHALDFIASALERSHQLTGEQLVALFNAGERLRVRQEAVLRWKPDAIRKLNPPRHWGG